MSYVKSNNGDRFRYGLRLIAPPESEPITLAEAKRHLYEDDTHNDGEINQLISEARQWIENQTGVQMMLATWTLTLDRFPRESKWLVLPRWPLVSVDDIRYRTAVDVVESIDSPSIVTRIETNGRGRMALARWTSWPGTLVTPDAVSIDFTAGHATPQDVPVLWKRAILLLLGHWYENRAAAEAGTIKEIDLGLNAIIEQIRPADDIDDFDLG